jgi:hypothetical protein
MKTNAQGILVWPRPQEITIRAEGMRLSFPLGLRVVGDAPWLAPAAEQAVREVNRITGRRFVTSARGQSKGTLTVTTMAELPRDLRPVKAAEGYVLSVAPQGVLLARQDASGVFYGAQTLAQLLRAGQTDLLTSVTVRDWPRHRIRGAHLYLPPREHLGFFFRFLDFMAELKLNTLVLEIGGGMEYEKHPEINRAWAKFCRDALAYDFGKDTSPSRASDDVWASGGWHERTGPSALEHSRYFWKDSTHTELAGGAWLTKDELRRIKAECERRHIEIIPEVQSLSHSYYLCCAHPEIAERADDPWPDTYCPSNPKSYELLFDAMDEVIELFRPRILHIGHDEAYTFRVCPKCSKRTAHEILASDVNKIHSFLTSRGIRPLIWGDKLMNITTPDGTRYGGVRRYSRDPVTGMKFDMPATYKAAEMVPEDLLICDWYWSLDPESARNFHRHGFEAIYGNFHPLGFADWEKRTNLPYVLGAEMSTWCGVTPEEFGHNDVFHRFFPGADMLWRGLQMERAQVSALMAPWITRFIERMTEQKRWLVSGGRGKAQSVDLTAAVRPLPASLLGRLEVGETLQTVLGTGPFSIMVSDGVMDRAVVLDRTHPRSASIPIGYRASRLLVLQGTTLKGVYRQATYYSYERGPADVLRCRVRYADGKRTTFSAFYGDDIGPITGNWPTCYRAVPVAAGPGHTLFAQEWVNPRPDVPIASLTLLLGPDATGQGEVVVAALTAVR